MHLSSDQRRQTQIVARSFTFAAKDLDRMQDAAPFSRAVTTLIRLLGRKLTAYIAGARDASVIDLWIAGIHDPSVEKRIGLAHCVAMMLCATDQCSEIRAWFVSPQPRLGNRSPALVIRQGGDWDEIVSVVTRSALGAKYD